MRYSLFAILICTVVFSAAAGADEVFLKNGDRLSGTIVRLTDGKLVFKSDATGEVTVDAAHVQTLATTDPVEVHLKDGTRFDRRIVAGQPDQFGIETDATLRAQTFQLTDLVSINPPAKPQPKWTGSVSLGVTATTGNTSKTSANASVNVARRGEKDRITAGFDYAKGRQKDQGTGIKTTIEDWWRAQAQYDYFVSEKLYLFGNGRYEKDGVALLERRVVVGGGLGYQWIESPEMNFSTNLGAASVYEKYATNPDSNSEFSLQAGYNFDRQLTDTVKFIHNLTYFPAFDDFGDYYLTTTADLQASLTKTMFASFKTIFNYDATPAAGRSGTDVKYILSVGMTF
jgi:putative salt-induced outer membrane protein YdiY